MFLHSMPMEEVKSSISSVKFKKMGNDSIQYNMRTLRGFIQLAPYKLYETNLNVCLLLLARGARTCACAWNFNFFKSGPSWVLIPSKRRRATAESAARGVSELQWARRGVQVPAGSGASESLQEHRDASVARYSASDY